MWSSFFVGRKWSFESYCYFHKVPNWITSSYCCISVFRSCISCKHLRTDTVCFPCGPSGEEPTCQCGRRRRRGLNPWVRKIPWRRKWQPTPVFLTGISHGQRSLVSYRSWDRKKSDVTQWLSTLQLFAVLNNLSYIKGIPAFINFFLHLSQWLFPQEVDLQSSWLTQRSCFPGLQDLTAGVIKHCLWVNRRWKIVFFLGKNKFILFWLKTLFISFTSDGAQAQIWLLLCLLPYK